MANQWPAPDYTDGDQTTAQPVSVPEFAAPIPGVATQYVFKQDFQMALASFSTTALLTAHPSSGQTPDYSAWLLALESDFRDIGGGQIRWTRTYAKKPSSWNDMETVNYSFIGFYGLTGINVTAVSGRYRLSRPVPCKVVYDYFIGDGTSQGGATINDITDVPLIAETRYYAPGSATLETDFLADAPPFVTATTPSRATYEGWITADAAGTWSIVYATSRVTRWLGFGKIYQRETRYVKAQ